MLVYGVVSVETEKAVELFPTREDAEAMIRARTVEEGLRVYSRLGSLVWPRFRLLGVTAEQIDEWNLPSRPAKASDPEARKFTGEAVELDAIPPDKLISLVADAIVSLIDAGAWEKEQATEAREREVLERSVGGAA